MTIFVVAYDLNREAVRPNIVGEVKKTDWAKLSESSYAIDTTETAQQVYQRFRKHTDDNDDLYVISLRKPWNGRGSRAVIDWLNERLV